ncbi:hypothetical protein EBB07_29355 [Paenibacillaceae bacterium]|nr:hypothetical protein EBB07_29355 [Paenibacillaceae bacterium]
MNYKRLCQDLAETECVIRSRSNLNIKNRQGLIEKRCELLKKLETDFPDFPEFYDSYIKDLNKRMAMPYDFNSLMKSIPA